MIALVAHRLGLAIVDEVGLEPDHGVDPVLLAGLVVLDGAVHHPVVGEPQRGLPVGGGALGQRVDPAGAVENRVLGVDVEMGEGHPGFEYTSELGPHRGLVFGTSRELRLLQGAVAAESH